VEAVTFHDTSESATLARSRDLDLIARFENAGVDGLTVLELLFLREFADDPLRGYSLRELPGDLSRDPLLTVVVRPDDDGVVPVLSSVRWPMTTLGCTSMTVTGVSRPFSSKMRVMPTFRPSSCFMACHTCLRFESCIQFGNLGAALPDSRGHVRRDLDLDLYVHTCRQIKLHERVNCLWCRVVDVDQALVHR